MPKPIVSNQQILFLEKIQDVLSPNTTLAAELCEKLNCSADSAYRRIRGETLLSIDELITLSQKVCKLKSLVYLEFNPVFKNNQKLV
jgi:DNA-binding XRE family transcriptional regulator